MGPVWALPKRAGGRVPSRILVQSERGTLRVLARSDEITVRRLPRLQHVAAVRTHFGEGVFEIIHVEAEQPLRVDVR